MQSIYKVPQGKMIKIHMELTKNQNIINRIIITGDFFAYPEESISDLELKLIGTRYKKEEIYKVINDYIINHQVELIGINAVSLTEAIMRCE